MIDKIGWVISKVSRLPKLESFFSIQMMFLGNTEALAVIRGQLAVLKDNRLLTFGIMSMSSISGSILGSYLTMVPATYVFTAIPLNCLNALILASILNPVEVTKDEDIIYVPPKKRKGLFLNDFKQHDGRNEYGHRHSRHGHRICRFNLMFERYFGLDRRRFDDSKDLFLYLQSVRIPAWTGAGRRDVCCTADGHETRHKRIRRDDGFKTQLDAISPHTAAVATTFLTSFANFSTIGMIYGTYNSLFNGEKSAIIGRNVWKLLVSGIAVSLLSAGIVGLFVW